jgi:hypothetical protein
MADQLTGQAQWCQSCRRGIATEGRGCTRNNEAGIRIFAQREREKERVKSRLEVSRKDRRPLFFTLFSFTLVDRVVTQDGKNSGLVLPDVSRNQSPFSKIQRS